MEIAIIGIGNVGAVVGRRWAEAGHAIRFGARDPGGAKATGVVSAAGSRAEAVPVEEAAAGAAVVVLATPFSAAEEALARAGDLAGKVVLDCTNPLDPNLRGLSVGFDDSAGEAVARWAAPAKVAKALSTTGAANMADPAYPDGAASMFLCGDPDAKAVAGELCRELGFDTVDCGGIEVSRLLEPLAMLWISLAYQHGNGPGIAFRLMRR